MAKVGKSNMNWTTVEFESLYSIPSRNGLNRPSGVRGKGYKFINMGELFGHDRIGSIEMERVEMNDKELATMLIEEGDLLFARQSLVLSGAGKCSIVKEVDEPTTFESHLIRVRLKRELANPYFYHYYFKSPKCPIRSIVTQGVQAGIRGNDLKQLKIHLPPIEVQNRIADIISAYDDLIENNRRRIQLLERSLHLLYKEWFVHLRFPSHEHSKILDGIPQGWEKKTIDKICATIGGGTPSTQNPEYWDGDITWITPTDITRNDCLILLDSQKKITESGLRNSSAKLLPPNTILMTSRASVGFFALIDKEVCTNQGFISIIPHDDLLRMFLLCNLMGRVEEIRSRAGGTTYMEISKSQFRAMEVVIPPTILLQQFDEAASKILQQVSLLKRQTTKLQQARDLLLPKLMSGAIGV